MMLVVEGVLDTNICREKYSQGTRPLSLIRCFEIYKCKE